MLDFKNYYVKTTLSFGSSSTMVQSWVLQLILVVTSLAEKCTKAVPVQTIPSKKITVLRRVPAPCSNWDKAWAWLTKVDCGTKYRLDHVTVPPREVKQYKLEYGCCEGDIDCKEAKGIHTAGFDSNDEKFLAIVLGSTAACVVIVIIIFAITFYTKKSRCQPSCDPSNHIYASAEEDDNHDVTTTVEKQPEEVNPEADPKLSEAEYAEIGDSLLPRYTDIFKESLEPRGDPFNKATAPPLYTKFNEKEMNNSKVKSSSCDGMDHNIEITLEYENHPQHTIKYYNVKEKGKDKKSKRYMVSSHSEYTPSSRLLAFRSSAPSSFDMVKHPVPTKSSEITCRQKRLSSESCLSNRTKLSRSNSIGTCSVIHEANPKWTKVKHISEDCLQSMTQDKTMQSSTRDIDDLELPVDENSSVPTSCMASQSSEIDTGTENDSLLKTLCHSGCEIDLGYDECEQCLNYDSILNYDNDNCSVHMYQCLEDVGLQSHC